MQDKEPPPLPSVGVLLFQAPLYARYKLADDLEDVRILYGRVESLGRPGYIRTKLDGYCPGCKQNTTYTIYGIDISSGEPWKNIKTRRAFEGMTIMCGRCDWHLVRYWFWVDYLTIEKVGQWPSLADIAIEEAREKYRSVLRGENWAELYKAIGLAAHGEGIGSFVYLRRVFERLIWSRFNEFKASEGWDEEDFGRRRMEDKIDLLKDHLPASLVESRQLYGIFSKGIHELDNDVCLEFFDVGKRSIIFILEDDLRKREELAARKQMQDAVAKFSSSLKGEVPEASAKD